MSQDKAALLHFLVHVNLIAGQERHRAPLLEDAEDYIEVKIQI